LCFGLSSLFLSWSGWSVLVFLTVVFWFWFLSVALTSGVDFFHANPTIKPVLCVQVAKTQYRKGFQPLKPYQGRGGVNGADLGAWKTGCERIHEFRPLRGPEHLSGGQKTVRIAPKFKKSKIFQNQNRLTTCYPGHVSTKNAYNACLEVV
jgi:hypothetical protein